MLRIFFTNIFKEVYAKGCNNPYIQNSLSMLEEPLMYNVTGSVQADLCPEVSLTSDILIFDTYRINF